MLPSAILASAAASTNGGFQPFTPVDTSVPFFTWNIVTIIITVILAIIALMGIFLICADDEFGIPVLFCVAVLFFLTHFVASSIVGNSVGEPNSDNEKKDIAKYETWLEDRHGFTDLPDNLVKELYDGDEVTIVNVGKVTMVEQEKNTFYLVYVDTSKELPVTGNTTNKPEDPEVNW
jgi:hypothetical protein